MIKKGFLKNKKAEGLIYPQVIFIVLNITFILLLMLFVFKSSTGAAVYEQAYAKQLALIIDNAKPDIELDFNFEKGFELAEENEISPAEIKNMVQFSNNQVVVKLADKGGYKINYFSDYDVSSYFNGKILKIIIKEKLP